MRFLKSSQAQGPAEHPAAFERLNAIVERSQAEVEHRSTVKRPAETNKVRRRFWSPDELTAAG